jgi:hypothetical protein
MIFKADTLSPFKRDAHQSKNTILLSKDHPFWKQIVVGVDCRKSGGVRRDEIV